MLGALFGFKGRLSRPGFWEVLFSIVLIDVLLVVGRMYVADSGLPGGYAPSSQLCQALLAAAPWVIAVFTVWSLLAAVIKRCHDRGRTGALALLVLIPVIGWLWLLVDLFVLAGNRGKNRYGLAPHARPGEADGQPRFNWDAEPAAVAAAAAAIGHEEPAHGGHHDHGHGAPAHGGHDDHGHGHHDDHAAAHGHDAHQDPHGGHDHGHGGHHDDHGHDDHGHGAHGHEAHGHDDHGHGDHGHDDHGHGHDDHGHGHDDHGHHAHGHDDHGHAAPGHDDHGHGHGDHHGHDAHHGGGHHDGAAVHAH